MLPYYEEDMNFKKCLGFQTNVTSTSMLEKSVCNFLN